MGAVTHLYRVGHSPEVVEGDFALTGVEGHHRHAIETENGTMVLDPANDVADICTGDPIPVWADGRLVFTDVPPVGGDTYHELREGADGPEGMQTVHVVMMPVYVAIESELRAGRPHPRWTEDLP